MFHLHPQLEQDTFFITDLALCRVLMMNDSQFPWLILVPRENDCKEVYDLSESQISNLNAESLLVSKAIMKEFKGDKLNVAALGNMVPQLHIHHIVRFKTDVAWPAPVWGKQAPIHFKKEELAIRIETFRQLLK